MGSRDAVKLQFTSHTSTSRRFLAVAVCAAAVCAAASRPAPPPAPQASRVQAAGTRATASGTGEEAGTTATAQASSRTQPNENSSSNNVHDTPNANYNDNDNNDEEEESWGGGSSGSSVSSGSGDELQQQLQEQWGQCGCAALEMACEQAHASRGPAALAACTGALAPQCDANVTAVLTADAVSAGQQEAFVVEDSTPREECLRLLRRQVQRRPSEPNPTTTAFDAPTGEAIVTAMAPPAGKASRPFGWRVFAAPWCCGDCCYTTACFPCYTLLYDYVVRLYMLNPVYR
jgi:hypothetical protein